MSYNIYQDGTKVQTTGDTTFTVNGLTPATEYKFKVTQELNGVESEPSDEITVTTLAEAPQTPSDLSASNVTDTSADLAWGTTQVESKKKGKK